MKWLLPTSVFTITLLASGCGTSPITFPSPQAVASYDQTTCDTTAPAAQASSQFSLQPATTEIDLYPGQTASLDVAVPSLDGNVHQVQLSAAHMPIGLSVAPVQATTGSTSRLTFQSANNMAFNCFVGIQNVFSTTIPVSVVATSSGSTASASINLNVVLENPSFKPSATDLPVLSLTTSDGADLTLKEVEVEGTVQLTDPANPDNDFKDTMQIKGHGNSTWGMPKKPYNLKLDDKHKVLGMANSKKWILLANYDDKTMMRNALTFYLSRMFQMEWTPDSRFVELYMNGRYDGVYQVSEKVEIDSNRLDIDELTTDDNSGDALTGGYLLQFDHTYGDTFNFTTPRGLPVGSDDPDPPTTQQQAYIQSVVNNTENAIFGPQFKDPKLGWPAYLDKNSLVNWFIVEELIGNQDGGFWNSDYFYKKRGDPLLYMGPVWDFDISSGNDDFGGIINPSIPWIRANALWYTQLFQDPAFLAAVKARWTEMRPQVNGVSGFIDTTASSLNQGQANNYQRWPILYDRVWPNYVAYGSYSGEVDYLKDWMNQRVAYMDKNYLQ